MIPVLTYHSIDESGSTVSVRRRDFERDLAYLKRSAYTSLSLREAVRRISEGEELPPRGLILTFDDGYQSNLKQALPVMARYDFTATIFLVTAYVGKSNAWLDQHSSIPELPMMTWEEIREMRAAGIDFGAHTHSHPRLARLEPEEARREMRRSKDEIEQHLGAQADLFSYPYGSRNDAVEAIARELFDAAVGNRPGRLHEDADLHALDRINAGGGLFRRLPLALSGARKFGFYLGLKRGLDRARRALPGP